LQIRRRGERKISDNFLGSQVFHRSGGKDVEIFEDEPCNAMGLCTFLRTAYF
jgi:hypothetical protein